MKKLTPNRGLKARLVTEQTNYDAMLEWIRRCCDSHATCFKASCDAPLPKRLIDVGVEGEHLEPRLVSLSSSVVRSEPLQYLTLSYCWGKLGAGYEAFTTTRSSLAQREEGMPLADLPETFREAVQLCRALKVRYLWIDALCILQDDIDDWTTESGRMEHIFRNALCCIVATEGSDPRYGLSVSKIVNPVQPAEAHKKLLASNEDDALVWRDPHRVDEAISAGAVGTRAWCMQERYLSPRLLHFTASGLLRECNHGIENGETALSIPPFRQLLHSTQVETDKLVQNSDTLWLRLHQDWCNVIPQYRKKALTRPSDALPAISGLAREIARATGDTYVLGHWLSKLAISLCWYAWPLGTANPPVRTRAPTWSWASLDHQIMWDTIPFTHAEKIETAVTIVDVQATRSTPDYEPDLKYGTIVLLGFLQPVSTEEVTHDPSRKEAFDAKRLIFARSGQRLWDNDEEQKRKDASDLFWLPLWKRKIKTGDKVHQVGASNAGGLLVRREWDDDRHNFVYYRVGYSSLPYKYGNLEEEVIVLV